MALNLDRLQHQTTIEAVIEGNKSRNIGRGLRREAQALSGVISSITRHGAWDKPRKQKELIYKVKRSLGMEE